MTARTDSHIDLLRAAAERAARYVRALPDRAVFPSADALDALSRFDRPPSSRGADPAEIIALLDEVGSPATVASAGPRYFGFVTGGTLPVCHAGNWLASTWDQNGMNAISSPLSSALEAVVRRWLLTVLDLPACAAVSLVTGATMANFVGLAAARNALLGRLGWDVESEGLFGAPEFDVWLGEEAHATVFNCPCPTTGGQFIDALTAE